MSNQELPTLDPAALAQVSGGTTTTVSPQSDPVVTALTGVLSTIQSLAQQQQPGALNQQEMLLLLMILQQRNPPFAAASPWPAWGGPFSY